MDREKSMHSVRRWLAVSVIGVVAWTSACSGSGEKNSTPTTAGATQSVQSVSAVGVPFDPPSSFDLARTVPLAEDEVLHGTLGGTTFFTVVGSTLRAIDLVDSRRSWSVDLPGREQDYLRRPFVLGDTVVVTTGQEERTEGNNYSVNVVGIGVGTGEIVWHMSVPLYSPALAMIDEGGYPRPPEDWFGLTVAEYAGGLLVTIGPLVHPSTTLLLDPSTGDVRWTIDTEVSVVATGRYAIASQDHYDAVVVDMQTGKVVRRLAGSSSMINPRGQLLDPYGDDSYALVLVEDRDSSKRYLRFSSVDATTQPFVPDEGDIRYRADSHCSLETGQSTVLCSDSYGLTSTYGIDSVSGQVVWVFEGKQGMGSATQYHGNVYGTLKGGYAVVALSTGEIIGSDIGIHPSGYRTPIQVNEYGAVGMLCDETWNCSAGKYGWAPSSG